MTTVTPEKICRSENAPARLHSPGAWPTGGTPVDEIEPNECGCGCGAEVTPGSRFRQGHWSRVRPPKRFGTPPLCACGCGQKVERRPGTWLKYAPGHYHRSRRPRHAPFVDTDPEFWAWFAGFTDGEGHFGITISHVGGHDYPQPFFKIAVRADERPILEEIRDRLGCGRVRVHIPGGTTSNLQMKFEMSAVSDCLRLVEVFELHPLRAKKRQDFDTWAEAVREKAASGQSPRIWELRDQLIAGRRYDPQLAEGGDAK